MKNEDIKQIINEIALDEVPPMHLDLIARN